MNNTSADAVSIHAVSPVSRPARSIESSCGGSVAVQILMAMRPRKVSRVENVKKTKFFSYRKNMKTNSRLDVDFFLSFSRPF